MNLWHFCFGIYLINYRQLNEKKKVLNKLNFYLNIRQKLNYKYKFNDAKIQG